MVYIALYKGNYKLYSRVIRWFTNSKYSHCELYYDGTLVGISGDDGVRKKKQSLNPLVWDTYKVDIDITTIEDFYKCTQGKKYDWKGILLGCIFNLKQGAKDKYTCSEWVIECLDKQHNFIYPKKYISFNPQDVLIACKERGIIYK